MPPVHPEQRRPRAPRSQGRSKTLALSGTRISCPALLWGGAGKMLELILEPLQPTRAEPSSAGRL